jgi:hypothetical protein
MGFWSRNVDKGMKESQGVSIMYAASPEGKEKRESPHIDLEDLPSVAWPSRFISPFKLLQEIPTKDHRPTCLSAPKHPS